MKAKITVIGSANTDMIITLDRIPAPGETILGGEFATAPGGKGANQAVAAARAGGVVTFVARVGNDSMGDEALANYRADQIAVDYIARDSKAPSGVALIFVARDGENSIAVASGANAALSAADVRKALPAISSSQIVLSQLESPLATVEFAAMLAAKSGVRFILNPAPAREIPSSLLQRLCVITPNETETELLTGIVPKDAASAAKAARRFHESGVRTVIITLGRKGCFASSEEFTGMVRPFNIEAVDTTAAGDVFNGALAVAMGEGKTLREAVVFASAAGALSVTKRGAQPSAPKRRDIQRLISEQPEVLGRL